MGRDCLHLTMTNWTGTLLCSIELNARILLSRLALVVHDVNRIAGKLMSGSHRDTVLCNGIGRSTLYSFRVTGSVGGLTPCPASASYDRLPPTVFLPIVSI